MKWYIQHDEVLTTIWEVDAATQEDALDLYNLGEADLVEDYSTEDTDVWPAEV